MSIPPSSLGGGPFQGYSPKQTINNYKDSENVLTRSVLRRAWNNTNAVGVINGKNRIVTPFRAVTNLGDFLARDNYACNVPNPVKSSFGIRSTQALAGTTPNQCDVSGIPGASCNPKYVPDCSDYIRYKKQRAMNATYNDISFGGNQSNGAFDAWMRVR